AFLRADLWGLQTRAVPTNVFGGASIYAQSQEPTVLRSKHHVSDGNTRRLLEKENRFFCVRCFSKKLSLSCGEAKTMRPHSERGNYLSKLPCSLAPRKHTAKRY